MQLDHINICASAELMETVREFYCDVLGFHVGPRPEIPVPGYWLYGEGCDRASVHLLETDDRQAPDMPHLDHVAFQVASIQPIVQALDARKIKYGYLDLADFGIEQVQFLDPAGIKIEINAFKGVPSP